MQTQLGLSTTAPVNVLTTAHKGVDTVVALIAKEAPQDYKQFLQIETTEQAFERILQYSGFGYSRQIGESSPFPSDARVLAGKADIVPIMMGNGFSISKQAKVTDVYNIAGRWAKDIAISHQATIELVGENFFNNAFSSSFVSYNPDQLPLSTTSHQLADLSNVSNYGDGTYSVSLSYPNLEKCLLQMEQRVDHRGVPAPIRGKKKIYGPPVLAALGERLTTSTKYPQTNYNDPSYVNGRLEWVTLYQLTSSTAFFIAPADVSECHGRMLRRIALEVESDYKVETKTYVFTIGEEVAVYSVDWRSYQCSPGT